MGDYPAFLASAPLVANVNFRRRVVADENNREPRRAMAALNPGGHVGRHFPADVRRYFFSVKQEHFKFDNQSLRAEAAGIWKFVSTPRASRERRGGFDVRPGNR